MTGVSRLVTGTLIVALGVLARSEVARAQAPADTAVTARTLFDEARALMAASDYQRACPKFEESQRLMPGGGTLLNLALCHEKVGKTASAWLEFDEGLRLARRDGRADREALALEHIEALRPRLSRLRLIVPDEARGQGLTIRRNGVALGETSWSEPIPVDPGEQVIDVAAPGKLPVRLHATSSEGQLVELRVEPLRSEAAPAQESPAPQAVPAAPSAPTPKTRQSDRHATRRWLAWTATGAGAGTLIVTGYLTARAVQLNDDSNRHCSLSQCPSSAVVESRSAARYATGAVVTGVAGAVFVMAGAYLLVSSPSQSQLKAGIAFDADQASATVRGAF
jgi:hypothetical protein